MRSRRDRRGRAAAGVAGLVTALAAACGGSIDVSIPEPPTTVATTSTTQAPDYSAVVIPAVRGRATTTTIDTSPGQASLAGDVVAPDGVVPGATVRVQRLVGDLVHTVDVPTAADGTWTLPAIKGGRYRVRAWRTPDLAMTEPIVLFLGGREERRLNLRVERIDGIAATASVNPDPPVVDEPTGLAVLVADRTVDPQGIVRSTPRPFVRVDLFGTGAWRLRSPASTSTDEAGRAQWVLVCEESGTQPLDVVVDQRTYRLSIPPCHEDLPPTTVDDGTGGTGATGGTGGTAPTSTPRRRAPSTTTTTDPDA